MEEARAFDFTSGIRFLLGRFMQSFVSVFAAQQKRALRSRKGMLVTTSINHTLTVTAKHLQNSEFTVPSVDLACNYLDVARSSSLISHLLSLMAQ